MKRALMICAVALWAMSGCTKEAEKSGGEAAPEPKKEADAGKVAESADAGSMPLEAKKELEKDVAAGAAKEAVPKPEESADAKEKEAGELKKGAEPPAAMSEEEKKRLEMMPKGGLPAPDDDVVAWSEKGRVSSDTLRRYLQRLPAHLRTEYSSLEKKMDMLRNLIRLEALAEMAAKDGLDKDPDVLMAMKMEMAKKYLMKRFADESQVEVTDEEIEARYLKEAAIYNKPEKVRASQIVVATRPEAEKVLGELRAELEKPGAEVRRVFREFVRKYSIDEKTRRRGGDLLYFERDGRTDGDSVLDSNVVDAAFAMKLTDQVSSVIEGRNGNFFLLVVTSRREGINKPLPEVKEEIRHQLAQEKLEAERKHFADTLVNFDAWTFDATRVSGVAVEGAPSEGNLGARIQASEGAALPKGAPGEGKVEATPEEGEKAPQGAGAVQEGTK